MTLAYRAALSCSSMSSAFQDAPEDDEAFGDGGAVALVGGLVLSDEDAEPVDGLGHYWVE